MRIVVNDIAANKGGAMTVLKDFYQCVKDNDTENEWIFLLGDNYLEETENIKVITLPEIKKSGFKKLMFDFFTGKKFIKSLNPDVVFSMQNIITFGLKVPQVLYVHQPLPFQDVKKYSLLKSNERSLAVKQHIIGALIKKSVRKAKKVIVQTEWMKEAVGRKSGVEEGKIVRILPNVKHLNNEYNPQLFDCQSFFYPTSAVSYKNNDLVFKASGALEKENIPHKVKLTLSEEKSSGKVSCIGRIPYEEVIAEYNRSTLIFPSYIETFGYPLAEARQIGGIILAADTPFSRELLKGYENAYFFKYDDQDELVRLMKAVINEEITVKPSEKQTQAQGNPWAQVMEEVKTVV